jgi:hypothetical protein
MEKARLIRSESNKAIKKELSWGKWQRCFCIAAVKRRTKKKA